MRVTKPTSYSTLTEVRFYVTEARPATPAPVVRPAVAVADEPGVFDVDTSGIAPGRYYLTVVGVESGLVKTYNEHDPVDLPIRADMAVSPETVAVEAGMTLPLTASQRQVITNAIRDAQTDVSAYLGNRPLFPVERVETGLFPWDEGWQFDSGDEEVLKVLEVTAEAVNGTLTGYYTVRYLMGLDTLNDPALRPIVRYVVAHAMNSPSFLRMWRTATNDQGTVRSVSAEGQSISFTPSTFGGAENTKSGDKTPGALPDLSSLDFWRHAGRRVHQGPTRASAWPYTGSRW